MLGVGSLILNLVCQQGGCLRAETLSKHSGIDLSPGAVLVALL